MLTISTRIRSTYSRYHHQHSRALSTTVQIQQQTSTFNRSWKGTKTNGESTKLYTGGQFIDSQTNSWLDVHNPATQEILTKVPKPTTQELDQIVSRAQDAYHTWKDTSVLSRQQIMIKLQALIKENHDDLARSIVLEQGKTFSDAKGDVHRGLQVVEAACSLPQLLMGEKLEVSKDMDTETRKAPLGVTAAICPFNFPAMIPLWNILSIACGNSLILKPSERDPGASMMIAELAEMAGLPSGVLSIAHGGVDTVNYLCDHPQIKAISFVGSDHAGKHIYSRAGANGKRVQANLGAKNHCVVMPDASKNLTLNSIAGAAFGAAGQRCMALSVMITVGQSSDWVIELVERARQLKIGEGFQEQTEVGPVISPQSKQRIISIIDASEKEGAQVLLDGRQVDVKGYPNGNWVGPTILQASPGMSCYEEEIFGPVLTVVNVSNLDEAIELINRNKYGNGTAIFTRDGAAARRFEKEVEAGQIGINVPVPVPLPMFAWSGNKGSVLGGHSLYGKLGVEFWTQNKTTTAFWRSADAVGNRADVSMPTHR
ncbi:methylmalonate-semialdehyde dehydrogenase (acylating) [Puccinia graminis f. sp. tritici CRL 75-36-700-3]|uniref:methylmalonate-semialdehyde dehydrogenase (CoA acylating) n=1 Tax=Puccinia graminis f. sp. tritici (strain CRL 75-36-700-3 / race SCCL) TaxID=418459 RepID=E3K690_PUCGT|nr:methylmalonate-semialdehyde dehydrogenase (acylating) [Puccinia graminis f. sp. tritici CRL 75-36-700-3]EFP79821.1 methylmalonate-semialdehyde dehydrogenase (acylating) [Puccinia graminis f. sp. tritici CRL 75-36-700-3]